MTTSTKPLVLAKLLWENPNTGSREELLLAEGASVTIGRADSNDIVVKEQRISRQHAVINYRDGVFMLSDLGSANGVFVNDIKVERPFPLAAGDVVRLLPLELRFESAYVDVGQVDNTTLVTVPVNTGKGVLTISSGPQDGNSFYLVRNRLTIGRATSTADWEICLQDPSVSRPHAVLELVESIWVLRDLGSANGTRVNDAPVNEKGRTLRDGDVITFGNTMAVFRVS
ncbi:MAG: FHA domain-containing protein [Anaerolineae bacterium]|nr:FHA domain-containing protein [Anaerolineae bacterium]MCA9907760.1 FHA domain-containing protein [Anaerolineae bacterium]